MMPNPFDKFDADSANPFDNFDASAPASGDGQRNLSDLTRGTPAKLPGLSRTDKVMRGIMDPINGGAQLLTNMLPKGVTEAGNSLNNWLADKTGLVGRLPEGGVDQQVREQEQQYQAQRKAQGEEGIDAYRTLGNVVNPANLAIASRIPAAASLAGRMGLGAATGAGFSALTPVGEGDFTDEKLKQMAVGGATGGMLPAAAGVLGRIISPNASKNANLALLKDEGVRPTIGQTLGGRWNAVEEKLQSVPILGDAISMARGRSLQDFNKAAINRASGKIGVEVDQTGQQGVREAGDAISKAYDTALGKITGVNLDGQFNNSLMQLRSMAGGLTDAMKTKFENAVNQTLLRKVSRNGSILPDDYKAIDSELGQLAGKYGKSSVASEQELGDAVAQLQALLKDQMVRSNPKVADELRAADAAWANLVRVEGAAKAGKNGEGVFTPAQLNGAIQAADQSVRKRAVGRGTALMQDLGNAGQQVLGNRVPDSGTAGRAILGVGALGGGAAINPAIPAALLGGAAAYTPLMQRAMGGAISSRPQSAEAVAELLRRGTPYLAPGTLPIGLGLLNQ